MSAFETKMKKQREAFALIGRDLFEDTSKAELAVTMYHLATRLFETEDRAVIQARLKEEVQVIKDLLK